MTTAEGMLPQPGDTLLDRKYEVRKVFWAFLAALLIHLLVAFGLAAIGGGFSAGMPIEDKPPELTMVDLAPATVPKNAAFVENDESKNAPEPQTKTFESNANSIGASQLPATGELPLPSQEGKDRAAVDLETHHYSLANPGAQAQPNAVPNETPQPSQAPETTPQPTPVSEGEQFAMLTSTPNPAVQPSVAPTPQQPASTYRPEKQQTRLTGSITNRGAPSVNAVGTPLGRYQKLLYDAVGSRWYHYVNKQRDLISIGTLRLVFSLGRDGKPKNLKVVTNSSNESFANVCLQSVLEIELPPMPDDVFSSLPPEGLNEEMSFTMYAN
jgi:outer membrane biosynthesis protein TonB